MSDPCISSRPFGLALADMLRPLLPLGAVVPGGAPAVIVVTVKGEDGHVYFEAHASTALIERLERAWSDPASRKGN